MSFSQALVFFEGVVTYNEYKIKDGKQFPWGIAKEYFSKNRFTRKLEGGKYDFCIDIDSSCVFTIDHDYGMIIKSMQLKIEQFTFLAFKKIGESKILDIECDVFSLTYVDKLERVRETIGYIPPDTLYCTYHIAKNLKVKQPHILATLQGYRNTKILDGRFEGITMKVIQRHTDGNSLVIEAVKIVKMDVEDEVKFPPYPIRH